MHASRQPPDPVSIVANGRGGGVQNIHTGLPPLHRETHYPHFKKHLSDPVFYILPALMWCAFSLRYLSLTLPTVANPLMEAGGLWGESKAQGFSLFGPTALAWTAPFITFARSSEDPAVEPDVARATAAMRRANLAYPVVVKPDRGYQGWGVERVKDDEGLANYLSALLPGAAVIIQRWVDYGGEAGVFYIRKPSEPRGRIASLALTYAPHVIGDGATTVGGLVERDIVLSKSMDLYRLWHGSQWNRILRPEEVFVLTTTRSARIGAIYRDARDLVTPELEQRFDEIALDIGEFYFGRFDIRFESIERLQNGEGFSILELNGAGGEMLHIWDARTRLTAAYRSLWGQNRTLFAIGAENRRRGFKPIGPAAMIRLQSAQERLRRTYPPTT